MKKMVNTVLGPVDVNKLGKTLMHEHFWFAYPGYSGNTLYVNDREELVKTGLEIAAKAKAHGVQTIVDATANDTGREPELLKEIAERAELNIICATGYYYEGEGASHYFKFKQVLGQGEEELYELLMSEITEGIGKTGIKPGVIKLGTSKDQITPYEEMFIKVSGKVQRDTGIPIITHTERGTMGPEQAQMLVSAGANPCQVMVGHMDGNMDISYHKRVLEKGVFSAFDRFGIQDFVGCPMDEDRISVLIGLIGSGYVNQIMMAHDTVNVWLGKPVVWPEQMKKKLEKWHIGHIFENIIPALKEGGVTEEQINTILVDNPKRLFTGDPVEKRDYALQNNIRKF
ncbi:phosphotriesterase-related protein [Priestia aryabhattai]|uniref:phosphotriesterase family protein n=1 Tax=Priestia aryabhattai TaxID=412384 RepID=UPI0039820E18